MAHSKGDLGQLYSLFVIQVSHTSHSKTTDQSSTLHTASSQESAYGIHKGVCLLSPYQMRLIPTALWPNRAAVFI